MPLAIPFPVVDPVAVEFGPLAVRWYSLAYIAGLVGGAILAGRLVANRRLWPGQTPPFAPQAVWDLMAWICVGVVVGGRLGFVAFYAPLETLADPLSAFMLWRGGMSFHGGLLGAVLAAWLFARSRGASPLSVADAVACVAPLGIFLGRTANFVNGELWGRESDAPWAMVFPAPAAGGVARHPSQLYEAALEGLLLLLVLNALARFGGSLRRPGLLAGAFALGYGCARISVEPFREPDAGLGFLLPLGSGGITMGMLLSFPMVLIGAWMIARSMRQAAGA